jgi:hypothetical protein
MTLRSTPLIATWFLNQFGAVPENESAIGDLVEQYQRGRGTIWYWRQVLAIVYGGLYREFRSNKAKLLGGLFRAWFLSVLVHMASGVLLMMRYAWLHPRTFETQYGMTTNPFPLLTLRIGMGNHRLERWDISLFSIVLNVLLLLVVGRIITASARIHRRTLLLAYTTCSIVANGLFLILSFLMVVGNEPGAVGFMLTTLIAIPTVPVFLTIGGMREILRPKGEGGSRQRAG